MIVLRMENVVILAVLCMLVVGNEIPISLCKYGDGVCIKDRMNEVIKNHPNGLPEINLASLNPLDVDKLDIRQGRDSPVNVQILFKSSKLFGLDKMKSVEIKGFGSDIKGPYTIRSISPSIILVGNYDISGRILLLPISGNGPSNVTFLDVELQLKFKGKTIEKDGKKYMEPINARLNIKPKKVLYNFENLFNGDKALGDNMNKFLNENSEDIFGELKEPIEQALAKVGEKLVKDVFAMIPYEDFFAKEN